MISRKRLAVVHHHLQWNRGGGDLVAAWVLESLQHEYDLSLITWGPPLDWSWINAYYGTSLKPELIRVYYVPVLTKLRLRRRPFRLILAIFERYVKSLASRFDLMLSTYNEFDFGRPGIQYVHGPSRGDVGSKYYLQAYRNSLPRRFYYSLCDAWSGYSEPRVRHNLTLVNSQWGRAIFQETYPGTDPQILYPPVVLAPADEVPWDRRPPFDFLVLGDFLPEKKIEDAMAIVRQLRTDGIPARLHVIGDGQGAYNEFLHRQDPGDGSILWHGRLLRPDVSRWVRRLRYGLHMRDFEGFGIAVAEMALGGMIPFVHEGGGQAEIVHHEPALSFRNRQDAFQKVKGVLEDPALQTQLRDVLTRQASRFTADHFVSHLRQIVSTFH